MRILGLLDKPIETTEDDTLRLWEHAEALARFIRLCDTAMTIGIQGDWGSGKTSMMRMIERILKTGKDTARIRTVRINTWELAQFGQAENLPTLLLSALIGELAGEQPDKGAGVRKILGVVAKGVAVAAGTAFGQGEAVKAGFEAMIPGSEGLPPDVVTAVRGLKAGLEGLVHGVTGDDEKARVVVFIDDLDRLVPIRAVELLEVMKVFLDIPGCVFVLACDYNVVMKGLTAKFGVSEAQLSGKSFFDKIIQVPYNMPLHRYDIDFYLQGLVKRVGGSCSGEGISLYRQLTATSVGFNPRGLKRTMNALMLMKDVTSKDKPEYCTEGEWVRILFAILCLQSAYPALFQLICGLELSETLLVGLQDADALQTNAELSRLIKKDGAPNPDWQTMAEFCGIFYKAVQLRSDQGEEAGEKLSIDELRVLQTLLVSSALVAVQPTRSPRRSTKTMDEHREDFADSCQGDAAALAFFDNVFQFIADNPVKCHPGTQGVALWDRSNKKPYISLFPLQGTSRQPISLKAGSFTPRLCERLKELLPPSVHGRLDSRTAFSMRISEFGWDVAKPVFELLLLGKQSSSAPAPATGEEAVDGAG